MIAWKRWATASVQIALTALIGLQCTPQDGAGEHGAALKVGLGAWMLFEYPMLADVARAWERGQANIAVEYAKFGDEPPRYIMQWRQGRSDHDIVFGTSDGIDMYAAVRMGALADLSGLVPADTWAGLIPSAQNESLRYGARVNVPIFGEIMVLNYNSDLLRQAGIAAPAGSWQELERHAETIAAALPGKIPIGVRLYEYSDIYWLTPTLLGLAGTTEDEEGWPLTTGPAVEESLNMLRRWVERGYCNSVDVRPEDAFRSGDAVYFISWASHGSWARRTLGDDAVGVAPLPGGRAYVSFHFGTVPVFGENVDKAAAFLAEGMLSDAMQQGVFDSGKMGVRAKDYASGDIPEWMLPLRTAMEGGYTGVSVQRNIRELSFRCHEIVQAVASGSMTAAQAMENMTQARREVQQKAEAEEDQ